MYLRETKEEKTSKEARIFKAILDTVNKGKMDGSKIRTADITDCFNEDLQEKEMFRPDSVGRICSRLGFEKARVGKKGHSGIYWDIKLVKDLSDRYLDENEVLLYMPKKPSDDSVDTASISKKEEKKAESSESLTDTDSMSDSKLE